MISYCYIESCFGLVEACGNGAGPYFFISYELISLSCLVDLRDILLKIQAKVLTGIIFILLPLKFVFL